MEDIIAASYLNDYIFCPASLYFHRMYMELDNAVFQETVQINGTKAHRTVDNGEYSTKKNILTAIDGYSEKYGLTCRIDIFDKDRKTLIERKNMIHKVFDGFVFQLYAQYFALVEMGYEVEKLELYSMKDNRKYQIALPKDDENMFEKFKNTIDDMRSFEIEYFIPSNIDKCKCCIYEPACDRSLLGE